MVTLQMKNGEERLYPAGTTFMQVAEDISSKLAQNAVAVVFNEKLTDLNAEIPGDGALEILTFEDERAQDVYRHTSSHILAQAVQKLWPGTKLAVGPAIDKGFYYDFDSEHKFTPEDFNKLEKEMKKIIQKNYPILRREISQAEAIELFTQRGEDYKLEFIEDLPEDTVISIYEQGDFIDLCAGPHLPSTSRIKAIKLMSLAGAYWRGDERNKMLQRVYGTSFPSKELLDDYLYKLEEAKKRDHRKLGRQLDLFVVLDEGPGFPFFLPKGMIIRNQLEKFWREEHEKAGYQEIRTPIILNRSLWERSGHWDHYKENMYFTSIDEQDFAIKPMNCPGTILVYRQNLHSYREFPLRIGEMGLVHRHELSGVLHGLMRVRAFTQDDAHIFMLPDQIIDEIKNVFAMVDLFYGIFDFSYHIELSTRPEKCMGSDEMWDMATDSLRQALEEKGVDYKVNEGDGAFYGPKIDFHLKDSLDRTWQCGTIQLDFSMPEIFDLTYIGEDGNRHRPVMIHRVIFGSIERFIGILTEHFAGAFPLWLAPVQVRIMPITERNHFYAEEIRQYLKDLNIRVDVDNRSEKIGYKIREGQMLKIPYMLVLGDNETENRNLSVRKRRDGDVGAQSLEDFVQLLQHEIKNKVIF